MLSNPLWVAFMDTSSTTLPLNPSSLVSKNVAVSGLGIPWSTEQSGSSGPYPGYTRSFGHVCTSCLHLPAIDRSNEHSGALLPCPLGAEHYQGPGGFPLWHLSEEDSEFYSEEFL